MAMLTPSEPTTLPNDPITGVIGTEKGRTV
jgi:hypothetical protein